MIKVLVIDPEKRTIELREVENVYPACKDVIGGWLAVAMTMENEDTLYVDDEGLLKKPQHFFSLDGCRPLAGIGVLTGAERPVGDEGDTESTDVVTTIETMTPRIEFVDRTGFDRWVRAHSDEVAASITSLGPLGPTVVSSTSWGEMMEKKSER